MGLETDNLLESDGIEDALEGNAPAAPVVVVQDRRRTLPWVLIIGTIIVVSLGSVYAYREVARLRRQAELAKRDLERAIQKAREDENERRIASLPPPPAVAPAAVPAAPSVATVAQVAAGAVASSLPQPDGAPAPAEKPPASPKPVVDANRPDAKPAGPPRPKVLDQVVGGPDPAPAPTGPAEQPGPSRPVPHAAAGGTAELSPFDELNSADAAGGAPDRVDPATAPASAADTAAAKPGDATNNDAAKPAVPPADTPLPSREETERQLRAEAAALQQEGARRLEQQQEELQALRNDERRQFLDELRMILQVHGRLSGPEIERLSNRSGRTEDPKLLMRARVVIAENRTSPRVKVHRLRELGVPETVILDYLANNLNKSLGSRNGPRNRNEVWYKAAELLVKYDDLDGRRPAAPADAQGQAAPAGRPAAGDSPPPR